MTQSTLSSSRWQLAAPDENAGNRGGIARQVLFKLLGQLEHGCLLLHEAGECHRFGQSEPQADLLAEVQVHNPGVYRRVLEGGSIAAGESYMDGDWSSPSLVSLVRLMAKNLPALDALDDRLSFWRKWRLRSFHWGRRNSRRGARENIVAHYDLGNDFFTEFLDPTMMYSAAVFADDENTLEEASLNKLSLVCDKLELSRDDHLLEIGSGWGGLAIYAASHYGCKVTTTTLSPAQYGQVQTLVRESGLQDRVEVLLQDYRDLRGRYSKLVSIEMIEAVGHQHYADYFSACSRLLRNDGLMLLQAITIPDQRYQRALKAVDFIQRYIFPGGCLPSVAVISDQVARNTDMGILHLEDIGQHYARTLCHWRQRFLSRWQRIAELGYDQRFCRMWEFYLCYCEGGFRERSIGTVQLLLAKPDYRPCGS